MNDDNLVDLGRVRALRDFEAEDKLAYIEILWGEAGAFAIHTAIRDMEAMRRGTEVADKPLREPVTHYEAEAILRRLRYAANHLAQQWGLDHMARPEDW